MTQDERWKLKYNEVMTFMLKVHRKPSMYYLEEKLMFRFIHHNKKLYNAGVMKAERLEVFERLLEMCKKYKSVNQYM